MMNTQISELEQRAQNLAASCDIKFIEKERNELKKDISNARSYLDDITVSVNTPLHSHENAPDDFDIETFVAQLEKSAKHLCASDMSLDAKISKFNKLKKDIDTCKTYLKQQKKQIIYLDEIQ